jgi:hypothetical protein
MANKRRGAVNLKQRVWWLCVFTFMVFGTVKGQQLPNTYRGVARYVKDHGVDSLQLEALDQHFRTLNQAHTDSLLTEVFPLLEQAFEHKKDVQKARLYDLLTATTYQLTGNLNYAQQYVDKGVFYYEKSGDHFRALWAQTQKMFIQIDADSIDSALALSFELRDALEQSTFDARRKSALYQQLCLFYTTIKNEKYGLELCNKGLAFNEENDLIQGNTRLYETLANLTDYSAKEPGKSIPLRRKAIHFALLEGDSFSLRVIYRNLASSFMELGERDSVVKYFELTFQLYATHPYFIGWFTDQVRYAEYLLELGELDKLAPLIRQLEEKYVENTTFNEGYFALRERYAVRLGDYESYQYWSAKSDSLVTHQVTDARIKAREELTVKYEAEKKEAENKLLKVKSHSRFLQSIALLGLVFLLLVIVVLIAQRRKRDRDLYKKDQRLKQMALEQEQEARLRLSQKNDALNKDLGQRIKQVVEQQVINADLMEMVEELRTTNESPLVRKKAAQMKAQLAKSIQSQIFENIYTKMVELHPRLLEYLSEKLGPDKEAELVSTAMYFLGYESAVIAKVLNRSEKAIRNMRYRVRQKLGMENKDDFVEFLARINKSLTKI